MDKESAALNRLSVHDTFWGVMVSDVADAWKAEEVGEIAIHSVTEAHSQIEWPEIV